MESLDNLFVILFFLWLCLLLVLVVIDLDGDLPWLELREVDSISYLSDDLRVLDLGDTEDVGEDVGCGLEELEVGVIGGVEVDWSRGSLQS